MNFLTTSDIHLSDRSQDYYRFRLFKWLALQQQKYEIDATFILGDITQDKDNHSSALVNRTIDEMLRLKPPVFILRGNHDGIDPGNPFFKFMNWIEGLNFVVHPEFLQDFNVAMIPHCRDQAELEQACGKMPSNPGVLMAHNTFDGAVAETGSRLAGLGASPIEFLQPGAVWAGDIHKPQRLGVITYVGSPYSVRFGDNFTPRVLLAQNGKEKNLYFDCPRRWSLTIHDSVDLLNNENLRPKDQVKITVELTREEVTEWAAYKKRVLSACKELGVEVYGLELKTNQGRRSEVKHKAPSGRDAVQVFNAFCKHENVPNDIKKAGLDIIKG